MRTRVVGVEEEKPKVVVPQVNVVISSSKDTPTTPADPFNGSIKEIRGIHPNIQKKATRDLNKMQNANLQKTNRGRDGAGSKQIEIEASGYNYMDVVQPPFELSYLARLPQISAPHQAAIHAKIANIIGLGNKLVESPSIKRDLDKITDEKKLTKARRKIAQLKDELIEYFDSLNDDDSFSDTLKRIWYDYEAMGVGYLEIGRSETTGRISYLGHIPAVTMRVRRKRDGYVQIAAAEAVFFRNFGEDTPDPVGQDPNPNEVIMFKKYNPTNSFYGLPDIMAASQAIAGNEFAARFNLDYFENKAVPRHVIILKGAEFSQSAERSIAEFFETGVKGQNHRSLYVPLPGDRPDEKVSLEIKPVEAGVQDQSFEKYTKSNRGEILFAHRVPASMIGITEGQTVATALNATKTFKEQVSVPEQKYAAKKVNKVIREFTDALVFEFNELTLTDEDTQSKIDERHIKNQIKVPNEIRSRMGLPGLKGGDKVVELKPQQAADSKAEGNRERDATRSAATSTTAANGRNAQGEGRATPAATQKA